jgi:hypothetical protein
MALAIFKYLLSINRIAKLQSSIQIDCNSNTETFSYAVYDANFRALPRSVRFFLQFY